VLDVIVVGAGPVGLFLADLLHGCGHQVRLLEAGSGDFANPSVLPGEKPPENHTQERRPMSRVAAAQVERAHAEAWRFRTVGARGWWARAHAVGGRGNLWGGWLARYGSDVFEEGGWPYGARTLNPSYRRAETWLGAVKGELYEGFTRAGRELGVQIRPGTFATRLGVGFRRGNPAGVLTNTVVLRIDTDDQEAAVTVLRGGREETLRARTVVLAASPIETTRLLIGSGVSHPMLGRRLTDHHMLGYILFEPNRPHVRMPGLVPRPTAIIPRFVNRGSSDRRGYRGGYSLELLGPAPVDTLSKEQRRVLGIDTLGGSLTFINAIGEQWPHRQRYVDLAPRARDALGRRIPTVHFHWSRDDRRIVEEMKSTCREVAGALASPGAALMRIRDPFVHPAIYHPAGTFVMGREQRTPCDPWGAVRSVPNLWVADASVFPSGGDGHPTLTVLAHTARVADSVHRHLMRRA